mmetsp:Transcript_107592/g.213749  ORF Transcript_107592/g.213749 Transcript_107592/m.213749 type:complete len:208 (+) Transcript_107592:75-698(+)
MRPEALEVQAGAVSTARKRAFTDAADALEVQSQPQVDHRAPKRRFRRVATKGEAGTAQSGLQADRSVNFHQSPRPAAAGTESLLDTASRAAQAAAWITACAQEAKCAADELAATTRAAAVSLGERVTESAVGCDQLATMLSGVCSAAADLTNLAQEASMHASHVDVVTSMTSAIDVPLDCATSELFDPARFGNFMLTASGDIPEELT